MDTTTVTAEASRAATRRPVARWVPTLDGRGRQRLVMEWHVPDLDEAHRTLVIEAR